jgi:glycosyltransferase involved in cell wall biosynthesis
VVVTVPGPGPLIRHLTDAGATVVEQATPVIRRSLLSLRGFVQLAREVIACWGPMRRLLRQTGAATVVVNTVTPPLWFVVARLARRRVFCHVHEAEAMASRVLRSALYGPLALCRGVIANSEVTRQVLRDAAPSLTRRISVVHNTVAGPPVVRSPRLEATTPVRLLYVGRLSSRKGPHLVVEAVRLLKDRGRDVAAEVLGAVFPGNEEYEAGLRAQVAGLGLGDQVTFLGFRPSVWGPLAEADIAIVPSMLDESFGNTAVEAALAARPLIVSDIPGLLEATEPVSAKIVVPRGDAVAIADAVERIIDDWAGFSSRAGEDAVVVAATYSREHYARALLRALELSA